MRFFKCLFWPRTSTSTSSTVSDKHPSKPHSIVSSSTMQVEKDHKPSAVLPEAADEIKEFHFHVYWITSDAKAREAALQMRKEILRLNELGFFVAVPLKTVNEGPRGPHPMGSYEVWSNFLVEYHTDRAAFIGPSMPLYTETLEPAVLDEYPRQYPELRLGYSAPTLSSMT
ncbi:hypothetical protein BC829DRAFT_393135 [Chytridium lagenaria]|nr:hypothetical protein BC829DRAFT_393135 [Chytridium lagenaria]